MTFITWYASIFFSKERKTLYDMFSGSRVIAKSAKSKYLELKNELEEQKEIIEELKGKLASQ